VAQYTGTDFSTFRAADGTADLDPNWTPISGPRVVLEHIARRLMTPPGVMQDEDYGFDLRSFYSANLSQTDIRRIQNGVRGEALKVEGVDDVSVTVLQMSDGSVEINLAVTLADEETYPMVFVLNADSVKLLPPLGG
jgi:hypothetical protein